VLMKRLGEPPPALAKVRPDAPELLRDVIEGMLATDPAERFQTAGDVVRALDGLPPTSAGHATAELLLKSRKRKRSRGLLVVIAGLVVAGIITAVMMLGRKPEVVVVGPV